MNTFPGGPDLRVFTTTPILEGADELRHHRRGVLFTLDHPLTTWDTPSLRILCPMGKGPY